MKNYSQSGQDLFVSSLLDSSQTRYFFDIGCYLPIDINNTYLLEQIGWKGIALDIEDHSKVWKARNTPFILADATSYDYQKLVTDYEMPKIVDYLSLDIEGNGLRFGALDRIMQFDFEFKIITIEHDIYREYGESEREPQRQLLSKMGYDLVCSNVMATGNPFEDWWVNPKYVKDYDRFRCQDLEFQKILERI